MEIVQAFQNGEMEKMEKNGKKNPVVQYFSPGGALVG